MSIAHVQSRATSGSGTSIALAFTSNNAAGNLLVAGITCRNNGSTVNSCNDTQTNSWSEANQAAGTDARVSLRYAPNCASGANTVTGGFSGSVNDSQLLIAEYSGIATSSPLDGQNTGTGNGTSGSTGSFSTTVADALLVGVLHGTHSTISQAGSFTERVESGGGSGLAQLQDRTVTSTGSYSSSWTMTGTFNDWAAVAAGFKGIPATLEQEGFRWGVDDGNEASHGWEAAQDTNITIQDGQSRLLRLLVNATLDPAAIAYTLRYQKNGTGGYAAVPVGSTSNDQGTYFGGASGGTNPTTTTTITIPSSLPTDSLLCLHFTSRDHTSGTGQPTVTDNNSGAAWTQKQNSTDRKAQFWYKRYEANLSGKTITISGAVGSLSARLVVIENVYPTGDPITDLVEETNASGNETHAAITPTNSGSAVVFAVYNYANDNAVTSVTAATTGNPGESTGHLSTGGSDCGTHVAVWNNHPASSSGSITWAQTNGTTYSHVYAVRSAVIDNEVYVTTSGNIAGGGEATTARLTAPSGKSTSDFVTGRRWDDENGTDTIDITTDDYTEVEWLVALASSLSDGDYVEFRVYAGSNALDTYTLTPRWTVGASGSFQYTGSGGFTVAGTAALEKGRVFTPTGGVSIAGTAPLNKGKVFSPSGGITNSGTATASKGTAYAYSSSGGLSLAGEAAVEKGKVFTPSGGVAFAGEAASEKGKAFTPSGGVVFGGEAATEFTTGGSSYEYAGTGGFAFAGSAVTSLETIAPTGGDAGDGPAWQFWKSSRVLVRSRRPETPSPAPLPARSYVFLGQGGPAWGGTAATELVSAPPPPPPRSYAYRGSGRITALAGAAVTQFVDPYAAARREEEAWLLASVWGQPEVALLDVEPRVSA